MHSFTDNQGLNWQIRFVIDELTRETYPRKFGVDLLRPDSCLAQIHALLDNVPDLMTAIWLAVEKQATAELITTEDEFWRRLEDEDCELLNAAFEAFEAELRFFIQSLLRRNPERAQQILTVRDRYRHVQETISASAAKHATLPAEWEATLDQTIQTLCESVITTSWPNDSAAT